jgi:hypothetical protein
LCSQSTISRWENAPSLRGLIRLMGVMVDLYCASYETPPEAVTHDPPPDSQVESKMTPPTVRS